MNCEALQTFRQEVHKLLTKAKDATFELMDAVMTTRQTSSLAELSLSPMFRRQYPSTYEAIEDCRPQRNQLMQLCIKQLRIQKYVVSGSQPYTLAETRCQDIKRPNELTNIKEKLKMV